jgi:tRNA(Ile)-lysidine synthase
MAQKSLESPERNVLEYIRANRLISGSRPVIIAVSGGADSVCLLHILVKLRDELGVPLHVAHLNHKLRGIEADGDARYVAGLAENLGVPFTIGERDVKVYQAASKTTLEEAAREVRYGFFAEVAELTGADSVAAGHTSDDNVETVLLHLVRGTGTRGLRGLRNDIRWKSGEKSIRVIRPLLEISRKQTLDYCSAYNLKPRIDSTNLSPDQLRNRVRHQLIPLLEEYNERVADALLRITRGASDEHDFLDKECSRLWGTIVTKHPETVVIKKDGFRKLHPAVRRHLLRQAIEEILGNLTDIETRHIEDILGAVDMRTGKKLSLPGGLVFVVEYDRCLLTREPAAMSQLPLLEGEYTLNIPGDTELPGWRVTAEIFKKSQVKKEENYYTACFDYSAAGDTLTVRPRKTADRFQPLGMKQTKKVGEYMIDARIPQAWRPRVPVVCSPRQIVWIVGWRIDDRVKVTDDTGQVLRLAFVRI